AVAAGIDPDDARAWIRGADAEINDDLVPAGLELPGLPVLPAHLGADEGLLAEQYCAAGRAGGEGPDGGGSAARAAGTGAPGAAPAPGAPAAGGWDLDCGSGAD